MMQMTSRIHIMEGCPSLQEEETGNVMTGNVMTGNVMICIAVVVCVFAACLKMGASNDDFLHLGQGVTLVLKL